METYKFYGTSNIPKEKAATFGYDLFESGEIKDVIVYVNTHAIIPCSIKNGHRLRKNVKEIFPWIRLDVDVEGESKKIDKALKNIFYIKKPSTSHKKNPYKWHYLIPIYNVSQNYDEYKLQYYKFLGEFKIELKDKSLASVVHNTNPMGEDGIALTYVNEGGEIWTAPDVVAPRPKKLHEKSSDVEKSRVKKALKKVSPDCDYGDWLQVGFALYDWCPKRGFKLFDKWSKKSDKYDGTTRDKWDDFSRSASGDITIGSLFHMAYGEKVDPTDGFKVESGSVHNLTKKEKKKRVKERERKRKTEDEEKGSFNSDGVNEVVLERIKKEVMRVRGGFELLNNYGKWIFILEKEFWSVVPAIYGQPFNLDVIDKIGAQIAKYNDMVEDSDGGIKRAVKATADGVKKVEQMQDEIARLENHYKMMRKSVMNYITAHNQYETRRIEIDPFANRDTVKMVGDTVNVTLTNIFYNVSINRPKFNTKPYLEDFKEHFSHFDEFMKLVIAARFSSDRKKAYLHTKMVSGFGKSFLGAIFKELGLLVEMDMDEMRKAVRGEPSGVDPKAFITAWILQFDEVKYIPAELKKIYNEMTIAAKGKQRMTVPTYMKWLSSAEDISGIKGVGADDQFGNRISMWDMGKHELDNRPLFRADSASYFIALRWEIYCIIRDAVEEHIKMGKAESYRVSSEYINNFHGKYKIKAMLSNTVDEFLGLLMDHIREVAGNRNRNTWVGIDKIIAKDFVVIDGELFAVRVGSFDNIFATLAKEYYGDQYKAILYKSGLFRALFKQHRVKINGALYYKTVQHCSKKDH